MFTGWDIGLVFAVGLFSAGAGVFALILHALYLYLRYRHDLDTHLMGDQYFNGGFPYWAMQRLSLYTSGAMSPSFVKKIPLIDHSRFETIDPRVRTHLFWHGWLMRVCTWVLIISGLGIYAYTECWIGQTDARCEATESAIIDQPVGMAITFLTEKALRQNE